MRYNALIDDRHALPTRSVAVLLRPEADAPDLTGEYRRALPGGPEHLAFRSDVVRVWREPVAAILRGGLGLLPLAPLADLGDTPIEAVAGAMGERIGRESPALGGSPWTCTGVPVGLRFDEDLIGHLLRGTREMEESPFYQGPMRKGRAEGLVQGKPEGQVTEAWAMLLRLAKHRFGPNPPRDRRRINRVADLDRLRAWAELVLDATTWAEFWALAGGKQPPA